MAQQVLYSCH